MNYEATKDDAPDWQMMVCFYRTILALNLSARPDDQVRPIAQENIILRKIADADDSGQFASEQFPAIIVTLQSVTSDPNEGSNDEVQNDYLFLIQIVDADQSDKLRGLRTYLNWQNQIARRLNDPNLQAIDMETTGVNYEFKHVFQVNSPDRKTWVLDKNFQLGVAVRCTVREGYLTGDDQ